MLGFLQKDKKGRQIQGFETREVSQTTTGAFDMTPYMAICPQADVDVIITVNGVAQPQFTLQGGSIRVTTGWESATFAVDTLVELM